jgi:hypothetical protein
MVHPDQKRILRTADGLQEDRPAQRRHQLLRHGQHHPQYPSPYPDLGIPVSEDRKDKVNKDIFNKEVRILDFTVLLNTAAALKKEK